MKNLLSHASPVNPLDCTAQSLNDLSLSRRLAEAALEHGGYGAVLCFVTYVAGSKAIAQLLLEKIVPLRQAYPDRIFVFCVLGQPEVLRQYEDAAILVFSDPCRAVRALDAAMRFGAGSQASGPKPAAPPVALLLSLP